MDASSATPASMPAMTTCFRIRRRRACWQTDRLKPYEKRPWQQELIRKDGLLTNARHMQGFNPESCRRFH